MGTARVYITEELLLQMLKFPTGTRIVRAQSGARGDVILTVMSPEIRAVHVNADALPPLVRPTYRRSTELDEHGVTFLRLGQD